MSPERKPGPVSPEEAVELQTEQIPEDVFATFNSLIAQNLRTGSASVKEEDVLGELIAKGFSREEILKKNWLDVEPSYRRAGWKVQYHRPIYYAGDDFFEPYYTFSERKCDY